MEFDAVLIFVRTKTATVDLTEKLDAMGELNWIAPEGNWEIYIVLQEGTGQKVKRAAPGNIGLVLDPFSPRALKKYLSRYDEAFANYSGQNIRAQYQLMKNITLKAKIDNFFDKNHQTAKDYNSLGRVVFISMAYNLK